MKTATKYSFLFFIACISVYQASAASLDLPQLVDIDGKSISKVDSRITVYCFLATECPLAKLYGPRLESIADTVGRENVQIIGVSSSPQDNRDDVRKYIDDHSISFPIVFDADQTLKERFEAHRTPEVVVMDSSGQIRYRGRIDDQYQPGVARSKPTQHDLRDALASLIQGEPVLVT
ncbi:MAG: redoxin domain-containing protein, partial [Planctomycetota bacterium]